MSIGTVRPYAWDLNYVGGVMNCAGTYEWDPGRGQTIYYLAPLSSNGSELREQTFMVAYMNDKPAGLKVGDVLTVTDWLNNGTLDVARMARVIAIRRGDLIVGNIPPTQFDGRVGYAAIRVAYQVPHG